MRVSLRWIRELLPSLDASTETISAKLTSAGLEVEAIHEVCAGLEPALVVEVLKREAHPQRSQLSLVTVDLGGRTQTVVCGAQNVPEPGGKVVLAPVGAVIPGLGRLEPRPIGGVVSEGMLLSEKELGLADESAGILILDESAPSAGTPFLEAYPARDTILELGITPNRPDALGHLGLARELATLFALPLPPVTPEEPRQTDSTPIEELVRVQVEDGERCPHYGAGAVLDVTVRPSPHWLRWRLSTLGVRPISNVVDVTNLALLGFGQPMHAFDLDRVRGKQIVVRRAKPGETLKTLDGVDHRLEEDDLLICDGGGPTALAGVMGGADSEIRADTRRVLLECAYFQPRGVRRTARRHGLNTDSSYRFERGVDWGNVPNVLAYATALLANLADGRAVAASSHVREGQLSSPQIRVRSARVNALLGCAVPFAEVTDILERLGFEELAARDVGDGSREATFRGLPSRPDINLEVDLIEEVARVRGLDQIPTVLPRITPQSPRTTRNLERRTLDTALSLGLSEAITYAFVSERELSTLRAPTPVVRLMNPLSEDRSVLRTSLLPGLLEALQRARRRGEPAARLFTVGSIFLPPIDHPANAARPRLQSDAHVLPEERPTFAAVLAGPRPVHLGKPEPVDIWDAKGLAVAMLIALTRQQPAVSLESGEGYEHLHPRGAARLSLGTQTLGRFGPLHPDVVEGLDLGGEAFVVELDLAAVEAVGSPTPRYQPIPRLPAVTRDLALLVSDDIPVAQVQQVIEETAGQLCESVRLFDVFRGGSVPEGHRSLAFHLVYRDPKAAKHPDQARTLTDKEVDKQHDLVIKTAESKLGVQLRS